MDIKLSSSLPSSLSGFILLITSESLLTASHVSDASSSSSVASTTSLSINYMGRASSIDSLSPTSDS